MRSMKESRPRLMPTENRVAKSFIRSVTPDDSSAELSSDRTEGSCSRAYTNMMRPTGSKKRRTSEQTTQSSTRLSTSTMQRGNGSAIQFSIQLASYFRAQLPRRLRRPPNLVMRSRNSFERCESTLNWRFRVLPLTEKIEARRKLRAELDPR